MIFIKFYVNIMLLQDVQRRSMYAALTLFNQTFWVKRRPRNPVVTQWSCGYRKET